MRHGIQKKRWVRVGLCLQLLWLLGLASPARAENPLSGTWSNLDRFMSRFNPLGRGLFDPIEEAIPGLRVVGTLKEWADWNVGGNARFSGPTGAPITRKNWPMQQLTTLAEIELRYSVNPSLWLVETTRLEYNGAYDLKSFPRDGRSRLDKNNHFLTDPDLIIREAYVDWTPTPSWRFKVGRQQEAWGKMISPITDIIHGFDQREGPQLEAEDFALRRLNRFMVNATYYATFLGGSNELKLLWIPEFQGDRFGLLTGGAGSPWNPPFAATKTFYDLRKRLRERPKWDFSEHEVFARWTWSGENLTFFLMYGYLWDRTPTVWLKKGFATRVPAARRAFPQHSRFHGWGFGLDYAFNLSNLPLVENLPVSISMENFWAYDMEFSPVPGTAVAAKLNGAVFQGRRRDNHEDHPSYRGAIDFTFALPDRWTVSVLNALNYNHGWKMGLTGGFAGSSQWSDVFVCSIAHPWRFTDDRLSTSLLLFNWFAGAPQNHQWGGIKIRPIITYSLSQFMEVRVIATLFAGRHTGTRLRRVPVPPARAGETLGPYETFDRYDTLGVELNYTF